MVFLAYSSETAARMQIEKIKNKGQATLFQSAALEAMTKTHPVVIYSMYLPLIGFMLYYGVAYCHLGVGYEIVLFIAGAFSWSLFEYIMHRWLFHMLAKSKGASKVVYTMHGVHHEFPRDKERLFMPPLPSILVAAIVFALCYAAMSNSALAYFPGFLFGYLLYGSMHYAIHAFAPPRFLKALWRNHHLHHYKAPDKGFGVSSVLWDHVFRTVPEQEHAGKA